MVESNTVVSAYTLYRHLQQYCSHPSTWLLPFLNPFPNNKFQTLPNSKEFADDNFKSNENGRKFSKPAENTVGKGQISQTDTCKHIGHQAMT